MNKAVRVCYRSLTTRFIVSLHGTHSLKRVLVMVGVHLYRIPGAFSRGKPFWKPLTDPVADRLSITTKTRYTSHKSIISPNTFFWSL